MKMLYRSTNNTPLSELGYSDDQALQLNQGVISAKSVSFISGHVSSGKSPLQSRLLRRMRTEKQFKEKRQRREKRHQK